MSKPKRRFLILTAFTCMVICMVMVGCELSQKEELYQERFWSPNRQYYMQKYRTFSILPVPSMPGQGSDSVDGYIRIHDKDGKVIHERYYTFIRDTEAIWVRNEVILMGGGVTHSENEDGLILPTAAE